MKQDKKQKEKQEQEEKSNRRRRIVLYIIIIIIILLSLITSCSCTSGFFGKIGNIFDNEDDYIIDDDTHDTEIIRNKYLKFDKDSLEISLSDEKTKLGFHYSNIKPSKFTCTTSDASIATCYVAGSHVVIIPKSTGTVTIKLQTKVNSKIYEARAKLKIKDSRRYILLSSTSGTINLANSNDLIVGYMLIGLSGKVNVTSSNPSVAKVTLGDGYFKIEAYKKGKVTITVSLTYNGKEYKELYELNVINSANGGTSHNGTGSTSSSTSSHTVKDENNYLKDIQLSIGTLNPSFDKNNQYYTVNVSSSTSKINISAIASSKKSTILYNGKKVNSLNNLNLNYGDNTVVITVIAEDGTKRDYVVNVIRESEKLPQKDSNNYLKSLNISEGTLEPTFDKNETSYKVEVDNNVSKITIDAIASSKKATVTINGKKVNSLKDFELEYGDNTVVVSVTAENGVKKDYTITIFRKSEYTVKIEKTSYDITLYAENLEYPILYKVYKNGKEIKDYNLDDIKVQLEESFKDDITILPLTEKGVVTIVPDSKKISSKKQMSTKLSIGIEGLTDTILNFKMNEYYLDTDSDNYSMSVVEQEDGKLYGEGEIILRTNFFAGDVDITDIDEKTAKICTKNKNACITVSTDSSLIDSLTIDKEEDNGVSSIVVKVESSTPGSATIHVSSELFDKTFKDFDINLDIIRKYSVLIDANGGLFDEDSTNHKYEIEKDETYYLFEISKDEKIDLALLKEPYKLKKDDKCRYYKFIGYSNTPTSEITYNRTDKNIISNLDSNLVLYARYEDDDSPLPDEINKSELWLVANGDDGEVPLFNNKVAANLYKDNKLIYPGANGSYIMNFTNHSSNSVTITGMKLKEETICINDKDCLNMGYIIKYAAGSKFYYGSQDNYKILNQDVSPTTDDYMGKLISFDKKIVVASKETVTLSIFWKWVEENNLLDTAIGNKVTSNDFYKLYVALEFEKNSCDKTGSSDSS